MDAQRIAIAQDSLRAAYDGSLSFPEIVGSLIGAGFEAYLIDYRRQAATYYLPDGDSVTLEMPVSEGAVAAAFDQAGIAAQIKWAQANPPDYAYTAFCAHVKAQGCAGYLVSFLGRRVVYFGRSAETHVEHFPQ